MEIGSAREEAGEEEAEENCFFPIKAFDQGEHDAAADGDDRQPPCRGDAPLKTAGEDDEESAGEAGKEV
jgi:hypothetical protein